MTRVARKERQVRPVVATFAMLLGAAMLLPAVPPALAQIAPSASVAPSASIAPSASPCPVEPVPGVCVDAEIHFAVSSATDPVRDWTMAVIGGVPFPSGDDFTVPDPADGAVLLTFIMFGPTATVELTATLPAGSQLIRGSCIDQSDIDQVPVDVLVAPQRLAIEVVRGSGYECVYQSDAPGAPEPTEPPEPTVPPTDTLVGVQPYASSEASHIVLAVMAAVIGVSLIAARVRPDGRPGPRGGGGGSF